MGKKNNPNRDNISGKEQRLIDNSNLICSTPRCTSNRYGYSKYCLQHKNHIASTGSLEQPYIKNFKSILKPYVEVLEKQIDKEVDVKNSAILSSVEASESLLNYPDSVNHISIDYDFKELIDNPSKSLPQHIIKSFESFTGDAKKLLAIVVSIFLFQKDEPKVLHTGAPLFFHCGKLIYSYTKYEKTLSARGKTYYKKRTLTKNQYINIGVKFYSKFHSAISYFLKQYEVPSVSTLDNPLRVKKTPLELLIEEKQERIDFIYEQKKNNSLITDAMVQKEVRAIERQFNRMIREEELKNNND